MLTHLAISLMHENDIHLCPLAFVHFIKFHCNMPPPPYCKIFLMWALLIVIN